MAQVLPQWHWQTLDEDYLALRGFWLREHGAFGYEHTSERPPFTRVQKTKETGASVYFLVLESTSRAAFEAVLVRRTRRT
ncbi:unnamed protein product, partial [Durusdinium trenchii]